jgi:hypothetical protein
MAISLVQQTAAIVTGATTVTLAYPSSNTAGNLLIVCCFGYSNSGTIAVTDSASNIYSTAQTQNTNWGVVNVFYAPNCNGGANTVSATAMDGGGEVHVLEWSGVKTASPLDQHASNLGSTTAISSSALTTTGNGELVFAFTASTSAQSVGSGFTKATDATGGNLSEYLIQTSAGSVTATETQGSAGAWAMITYTFFQATAVKTGLALLGVG